MATKAKKVDLNLVAEVITQLADADMAKEAIKLINNANKDDEKEVEKEKKPKKQFGVFILQPDGVELPDDMTGWVFQVNEETNLKLVLPAVARAADTYNTTKKGRKNPAKLTGEAFERVPAKIFKESMIAVKTKMPIWILPAPVKLPPATSE